MKKTVAILSATMLCAATLTACSSGNARTFNATYFHADPSVRDIVDVDENLTYDVYSFSGTDAVNGYENLLPTLARTTDGLSFEVTDGSSYTTSVTTAADKSGYVFKSKLTVNGVYTYGDGKTYSVEGDTTEVTVNFKGIDGAFKPTKVVKKMTNVCPVNMNPTSSEHFIKIGCTYTIEYGKNAVISVEPADDADSKNYFAGVSEKDITVKKYDKKDFVDNDLLFTVFRNFDYEADFSFAYSTIDAISGGLASANATVIGETGKSPVKLVSRPKNSQISYENYNSCGVKFSTTGDNSKPYAYCYYALSRGKKEVSDEKDDDNRTRRAPLIIAQPMIHNTGYMVMTLKTTNFGM